MRKILFALFVLALLVLDWAALHDIIRGDPSVRLEWSFVIGSVLLLIAYVMRKICQPV